MHIKFGGFLRERMSHAGDRDLGRQHGPKYINWFEDWLMQLEQSAETAVRY